MNRAMSQQPVVPSPEAISQMLTEWVDPITDEPPGTRYCLYLTPTRGVDAQGSYLIYLPPDYDQNALRISQ